MRNSDLAPQTELRRTPLYGLHQALGARMVGFAGWDMPVKYGDGILAEHAHVREAAGLFDVSHMGQAWLAADGDVARLLETLVPSDIRGLAPGRMRYSLLLAENGGIIDDLMIVRPPEGERLLLIVNAANAAQDYAHISERLSDRASLEPAEGLGLLALQGPQAVMALARLCPAAAELGFMGNARLAIDGISCLICRSGYTGEDGFEISVPGNRARALAERLLALSEVGPAGLGARDSLRLEAGLCLHGHDIDRSTDPAEAGLAWIIPKLRRTDGGFLGDRAVQAALAAGPKRCRIGLRLEGHRPVRAGSQILDRYSVPIGSITSGGYSPTLAAPVAMGYVGAEHAEPGSALHLDVRGTAIAAAVVPLPFVPHRRHHRP
ncbi:MAG: glycine cleavage system aminomethyltransferase GcvT [Alphaproteobacteria bacterium]|nr:glycine cleavage system aminomethyltransferase GcvT [Alphaproteobacteria bacterium]